MGLLIENITLRILELDAEQVILFQEWYVGQHDYLVLAKLVEWELQGEQHTDDVQE